MWITLPDILRRNFPTTSSTEDHDPLCNAKLVLCAGTDSWRVQPESAVIIYKDAQYAPKSIPPGQNAVAVVDCGNPSLIEQVSATMLPAITCGLSTRDTLTLTSFKEDSAVLGLQRVVTCFDGSLAEPQEIPLALRQPIDSFTLMAIASVFILSGNAARLRYAVF